MNRIQVCASSFPTLPLKVTVSGVRCGLCFRAKDLLTTGDPAPSSTIIWALFLYQIIFYIGTLHRLQVCSAARMGTSIMPAGRLLRCVATTALIQVPHAQGQHLSSRKGKDSPGSQHTGGSWEGIPGFRGSTISEMSKKSRQASVHTTASAQAQSLLCPTRGTAPGTEVPHLFYE